MTPKQKLKKLVKLWCDWNRKRLSGDEFAYQFGNIFEKETLLEWNKNPTMWKDNDKK